MPPKLEPAGDYTPGPVAAFTSFAAQPVAPAAHLWRSSKVTPSTKTTITAWVAMPELENQQNKSSSLTVENNTSASDRKLVPASRRSNKVLPSSQKPLHAFGAIPLALTTPVRRPSRNILEVFPSSPGSIEGVSVSHQVAPTPSKFATIRKWIQNTFSFKNRVGRGNAAEGVHNEAFIPIPTFDGVVTRVENAAAAVELGGVALVGVFSDQLVEDEPAKYSPLIAHHPVRNMNSDRKEKTKPESHLDIPAENSADTNKVVSALEKTLASQTELTSQYSKLANEFNTYIILANESGEYVDVAAEAADEYLAVSSLVDPSALASTSSNEYVEVTGATSEDTVLSRDILREGVDKYKQATSEVKFTTLSELLKDETAESQLKLVAKILKDAKKSPMNDAIEMITSDDPSIHQIGTNLMTFIMKEFLPAQRAKIQGEIDDDDDAGKTDRLRAIATCEETYTNIHSNGEEYLAIGSSILETPLSPQSTPSQHVIFAEVDSFSAPNTPINHAKEQAAAAEALKQQKEAHEVSRLAAETTERAKKAKTNPPTLTESLTLAAAMITPNKAPTEWDKEYRTDETARKKTLDNYAVRNHPKAIGADAEKIGAENATLKAYGNACIKIKESKAPTPPFDDIISNLYTPEKMALIAMHITRSDNANATRETFEAFDFKNNKDLLKAKLIDALTDLTTEKKLDESIAWVADPEKIFRERDKKDLEEETKDIKYSADKKSKPKTFAMKTKAETLVESQVNSK